MLECCEIAFSYTEKLSPVKDWNLHAQWPEAKKFSCVSVTLL